MARFQETFLLSVAGKLGSGALELGVNLGVELPAIKSLEANHPRDVQRVLLEILVKWNNGLKEKSESAVMEQLCSAFSNMHRNDVVLFIQNEPNKFEKPEKKPVQEQGDSPGYKPPT